MLGMENAAYVGRVYLGAILYVMNALKKTRK